MTGIAKTRLRALLDRTLEIGIVQNNLGRLATEFLRDPFHRRSSGQGHGYARSRRPSEGDHGYVRMRGNRAAHGGPIAIHQIEYARRKIRLIEDLGK